MTTVGWDQVSQNYFAVPEGLKESNIDIIQAITVCALQKNICLTKKKLVGTDGEVKGYSRVMKFIHVKL